MRIAVLIVFLGSFMQLFGQDLNFANNNSSVAKQYDLAIGLAARYSPVIYLEFDRPGSKRNVNPFIEYNYRRRYGFSEIKRDSLGRLAYCNVDKFLVSSHSDIMLGLAYYPKQKSFSETELGADLGLLYRHRHYHVDKIKRPLEMYLVGRLNFKFFFFKDFYLNPAAQMNFGFSYAKNRTGYADLVIPEMGLDVLLRLGYQW